MRTVKLTRSGHALLNVGCGTRMHREWNNVDFSAYARLVRRPGLVRLLVALGVLSKQRQHRLSSIDPEIVVWDLRKGIPFADGSFDAVYHSHFLEHLDRRDAKSFLRECNRVLKAGGVLRVVVPDLERLARNYLATIPPHASREDHDAAIEEIFEQVVRREAFGGQHQRQWVRWLERFIRGDAAAIGELHRWMYDRCSLGAVLEDLGFQDPSVREADVSAISGWQEFYLDCNPDGSIYKPGSLFLEATKR